MSSDKQSLQTPNEEDKSSDKQGLRVSSEEKPPSEIRRFLMKYAIRKNIRIQEYKSSPTSFYCHLQSPGNPKSIADWKTATAVSAESADNALSMAFLNLGNPEIDFL